MRESDRYSPWRRYTQHKAAAKSRGIPFLLAFEEWWMIWRDSGKWDQRGSRRGQYVMARFGDKGPYAIGNVRICTSGENLSEGQNGTPLRGCVAPGFELSPEKERLRREKCSLSTRGKPKPWNSGPKSDVHRAALAKAATGRRKVVRGDGWHWAHPGDQDYPD